MENESLNMFFVVNDGTAFFFFKVKKKNKQTDIYLLIYLFSLLAKTSYFIIRDSTSRINLNKDKK